VEVQSFTRGAPVAPKKVRLILNEVRGKRIAEAMALLRFMNTPHARIIAKAIRSAAANAENNYSLDLRRLLVTRAYVGDGERLRRMLPRARGRADVIHRRKSNITIIVEEVN